LPSPLASWVTRRRGERTRAVQRACRALVLDAGGGKGEAEHNEVVHGV
jgi:hypothetical protein